MDVEARIAQNTVKRAVIVGPVVVGVSWLVRGGDGAVAAAIGVGVVMAMFLMSGWMLSIAARIGLSAYHAAALIGFFVRLGLLVLAMVLITRVMELDRFAFGIATVVAYLALITWETIAVSRGAERELEWIN